MEDLSHFEEEEIPFLTPGHDLYPIGYGNDLLEEKVEIRIPNSNISELTQRELSFITSARTLIFKERFPNIPLRKEILTKLNPIKYGMKGINPLYRELDCKVNRIFTSTLRRLRGKYNRQ